MSNEQEMLVGYWPLQVIVAGPFRSRQTMQPIMESIPIKGRFGRSSHSFLVEHTFALFCRGRIVRSMEELDLWAFGDISKAGRQQP